VRFPNRRLRTGRSASPRGTSRPNAVVLLNKPQRYPSLRGRTVMRHAPAPSMRKLQPAARSPLMIQNFSAIVQRAINPASFPRRCPATVPAAKRDHPACSIERRCPGALAEVAYGVLRNPSERYYSTATQRCADCHSPVRFRFTNEFIRSGRFKRVYKCESLTHLSGPIDRRTVTAE
jgi:hypothetical protein